MTSQGMTYSDGAWRGAHGGITYRDGAWWHPAGRRCSQAFQRAMGTPPAPPALTGAAPAQRRPRRSKGGGDSTAAAPRAGRLINGVFHSAEARALLRQVEALMLAEEIRVLAQAARR